VKHDCAGVLELSAPATVEEEFVFPLLKGSDVARGRSSPRRSIILPQRTLGEDTSRLEGGAPRLWRYLQAHRGSFEARKSSIYRRQPPFAIFGVGPYTFAPWKLAICGLYKRLAFTVIGPHEGRPVILDDTCYFLPFDTEPDARAALESLRSPLATDFFTARAFWDSKRPITKTLLQALDLSALRKTV
jgi:hypothetical protein